MGRAIINSLFLMAYFCELPQWDDMDSQYVGLLKWCRQNRGPTRAFYMIGDVYYI